MYPPPLRDFNVMSRFGFIIVAVCCVCLTASDSFAQFSEDDRTKLMSAIEATEANFTLDQLPDPEAAKAELLATAEKVQKYFQRATDPDDRDTWLQFLNLVPLLDAIKSEAADAAVMGEAKKVRDRLIGMTPGLELDEIGLLRDSAWRLYHALGLHSTEGKRVIGSFAPLKKLVSELKPNPSTEQFAQIGFFLGVIESSGQGDALLDAFQTVFNRPNVVVLVGGPLIQKAIDRKLTRVEPVRETILGTRIVGTATMDGAVTAKLMPSTESAQIEIGFKGQVVSNNTGYNGPVRLLTTGVGEIDLLRTLNIDSSGFHLSGSKTDVQLQTEIDAICHKMELVRKIAWKTARRQKPKADCIATQRLKKRVSQQFEADADKLSPAAASQFLDQGGSTLQRLSLSEPTHAWSSTEQTLAIDSLFRGDHQLGSVIPRPAIDETFDAAIQIHESAIENACAIILAGRTLDEKKLDELLGKVGRGPDGAEAVQAEENLSDEPFEIVFAQLRPIVFEARDEKIRLGVRGRRFTKGNRVLQKALEVTATYKPTTGDDGVVVLQREGKIKVGFGGKKLSISEAGMKPVIEKSFAKVFPDVILERSLKVADDANLESLRGTEFRPRLVKAADGWLTIAIR